MIEMNLIENHVYGMGCDSEKGFFVVEGSWGQGSESVEFVQWFLGRGGRSGRSVRFEGYSGNITQRINSRITIFGEFWEEYFFIKGGGLIGIGGRLVVVKGSLRSKGSMGSLRYQVST